MQFHSMKNSGFSFRKLPATDRAVFSGIPGKRTTLKRGKLSLNMTLYIQDENTFVSTLSDNLVVHQECSKQKLIFSLLMKTRSTICWWTEVLQNRKLQEIITRSWTELMKIQCTYLLYKRFKLKITIYYNTYKNIVCCKKDITPSKGEKIQY